MSQPVPGHATVEVDITDTIHIIRLCRVHVRNALDNAAIDHLRSAVAAAVQVGATAIVFEGADGSFCAGSDVKALRANGWDYQRWHTIDGQDLMNSIEAAPLLTVALMSGYALGGGMELALACDVRVATSDLVCGFPEVGLGAIPAWGGTQRLPRFVGLGRAKRLMLTAERVNANDARAMGLVDEVFDSPVDAKAYALKVAARSGTFAVRPFSDVKSLLLSSADAQLHQGLHAERAADQRASGSIAAIEDSRGP